MDGKPSKNQNDMTFQMKVLLYKNQAFLQKHRDCAIVDSQNKAERRTKELLQLSAKLRGRGVKSLDEEMECMLDHLEELDSFNTDQDDRSWDPQP